MLWRSSVREIWVERRDTEKVMRSGKNGHRERGEGRAMTHCGVIALPYTPECVLFGLILLHPQTHLILNCYIWTEGPAKMVPYDLFKYFSFLIFRKPQHSICSSLHLLISSQFWYAEWRNCIPHPVTAHIWQFQRQGYTLTILSGEGFSQLLFLCHQIQ